MPELAGDCPKISLGEFFLDASVPNGPKYNTPELIGDPKKLTGPNGEGGAKDQKKVSLQKGPPSGVKYNTLDLLLCKSLKEKEPSIMKKSV